MDTTKFTMGIVGLVVIILLVTSAVLPAVEDAQKEQHNVEMNAGEHYSLMPSTADLTLSLVDGAPAMNGTKLSELFESLDADLKLYVIADKIVARAGYNVGTNTWSTWTVQSNAFTTLNNRSFTITSGIEVTFVAGTFTATNSNEGAAWTEFTGTYSYLIVPDNNGKYGAFLRSELPKFVDSDSTIYVVDALSSTFMVVSGKLSDLELDMAYGNGAEITEGGLTADYTPTEYDASNSLTGFTRTGSISYTSGAYVFIPLEYTVITSDQNSFTMLIGIIPLLLIIVAVLYAVRLMGASRN